jgi:hypothetical protein
MGKTLKIFVLEQWLTEASMDGAERSEKCEGKPEKRRS